MTCNRCGTKLTNFMVGNVQRATCKSCKNGVVGSGLSEIAATKDYNSRLASRKLIR